tara:strand:+ start:122 stop:340 length:219 start_codon:yes stop_codon:yes gene_type:complete
MSKKKYNELPLGTVVKLIAYDESVVFSGGNKAGEVGMIVGYGAGSGSYLFYEIRLATGRYEITQNFNFEVIA